MDTEERRIMEGLEAADEIASAPEAVEMKEAAVRTARRHQRKTERINIRLTTDAAHKRQRQFFEVVLGIPFLAAIVLQLTLPLSFPLSVLTPAVSPLGAVLILQEPLYLGGICILLGIAPILVFPWLLMLLLPAFVVCHIVLVLPEEQYLATKFGEEYRIYSASVYRRLGTEGKSRIRIESTPESKVEFPDWNAYHYDSAAQHGIAADSTPRCG